MLSTLGGVAVTCCCAVIPVTVSSFLPSLILGCAGPEDTDAQRVCPSQGQLTIRQGVRGPLMGCAPSVMGAQCPGKGMDSATAWSTRGGVGRAPWERAWALPQGVGP